MSAIPTKLDQVMAQMRAEFQVETDERLDRLQDIIMDAVGKGHDPVQTIYREAHSLKGSGGTLGFPAVTLICHRLEEYIEHIEEVTEANATDLLNYVDTLRDAVVKGTGYSETEALADIRDLPRPPSPEFEVGPALDVQVLLITQSRSIERIVSQEMRACGYRVTATATFSQGFQFAVGLTPDMIIVSATLDGISGADFAGALRAMAPTQDIPVAILTSFSGNHEALERVPKDMPLIHLNESLSDDLADAVARFGIA